MLASRERHDINFIKKAARGEGVGCDTLRLTLVSAEQDGSAAAGNTAQLRPVIANARTMNGEGLLYI